MLLDLCWLLAIPVPKANLRKVFFHALLACPKNVDVVFRLGKKVTKGKGESAGADLPSKDELRKTITAILKKVDFHTVSNF